MPQEQKIVTLENVVAAVAEFNKVLKLNPPINTEYPITARGAAANAQKNKAIKEMCDELSDLLSDPEMVVDTDMPNLTPETQSIVREVATPADVARLFPDKKKEAVAGTDGRKRSKGNAAGSKKPKGDSKPGVIATIVEIIKEHGPITQEEILKKMVQKFPDREAKGMNTTIKIQIGGKKRPLRLEKSKGIEFVVEDGKYSIK